MGNRFTLSRLLQSRAHRSPASNCPTLVALPPILSIRFRTPSASFIPRLHVAAVSGDRPDRLGPAEPSLWRALRERITSPPRETGDRIDVVLHAGGQAWMGDAFEDAWEFLRQRAAEPLLCGEEGWREAQAAATERLRAVRWTTPRTPCPTSGARVSSPDQRTRPSSNSFGGAIRVTANSPRGLGEIVSSPEDLFAAGPTSRSPPSKKQQRLLTTTADACPLNPLVPSAGRAESLEFPGQERCAIVGVEPDAVRRS